MTLLRAASAVAIVVVSWSFLAAPRVDAQDTLTRVRDLYTSAAYDEALAVIDQSEHANTIDGGEVDQYRAFCLLALGRTEDARKVIQQIVEANPSFQPAEAQISPRLQDAFREVRRRVLPSILKQTYVEAKLAFDRKDYEIAGARFESLMTLVGDPDVVNAPDLGDLRILSKGFLDLIKGMPKATPAPAPATASPSSTNAAAAAQPPAGPATPPQPAPPSAAAARGVTIYTSSDPDVTPPIPISQPMPAWHPSRAETQTYQGTLILVIDEHGNVESISTSGVLQPAYVAMLRRAAAAWKYQPAMRNGAAVKYRKLVAIRLTPTD